jgi:phenylalanyl-tRNA synthetase beta chain
MRAPISWIADLADLPVGLAPRTLGDALVRVGLEVERVEPAAEGISGPVVVGRVLSFDAESQKNGKTIRWCQVDVGEDEPRGIVCGAQNFAEGDLVIASLPGATLPGGFAIGARKTYGHVSDGMICSVRELGIGDDHDGILVLAASTAEPGDDAVSALALDDAVLDIAVTPDRGYCLSIRGLAREAAAALDVEFHDLGLAVPAPDSAGYPVTVSDPAGCDQFSVRTVSGLNPAARSPAFMVQRLQAAGVRSISLIVDVTNYVMLETGQPLHAFDRAKLSGPLGARRAQAGEVLITLDESKRVLNPDDLVVTDDTGPIALAGVMGGASTEIDLGTSSVVLEAAHWDPASIARAVRRHKLPSEAAKRFERGVDPQIAAVALQRSVELLVEHGGATADAGFTVVGDGPADTTIELDVIEVAALAGMPIPGSVVAARLLQVGCRRAGHRELATSGDALAAETAEWTSRVEVIPPSWRPDLTDPADLIEEVVRLEGYHRIPSVLPRPPVGSGLTEAQRLRRTVSRGLASAGYTEVLSYPFVSPAVHDAFGLDADDVRRRAIRLANPISDAEPEMRTSLLPGLLANINRNVGRGTRDLAIYEVGLVYLAAASSSSAPRPGVDGPPTPQQLAAIEASLPIQPRHLAVALTGAIDQRGWWGPARSANWADAIEAARVVARSARHELTVRSAAVAPWHPGRCAELLLGDTVVGVAGELHPRVIAALELPERTCAMELDLDAFPPPPPALTPVLSPFPPVLLDVAVVVSDQVAAAEVQQAIADGAGSLLESVRLFDVFVDENRLGAGRRSLAFSLRFRALDRTLTVDEATAARDAAVAEAARRTGAELRT